MLRIFFITIFIIISLSTNYSQNPINKNGVSFHTLWSDYVNLNGGDVSKYEYYRFGANVTYTRNLIKPLNIAIPVRMLSGLFKDSINNSFIYGGDILFQLQAYQQGRTVIPLFYSGVGFNASKEDGIDMQIPIGIAIDVKIWERAYLNLKSEYRISLNEDRNNLQHGVGIKYLFGSPHKNMDMDADNFVDSLDKCPTIYGAIQGCPDSDEDGIIDMEDQCPDEKGSIANKGCPDTDEDGIIDIEDQCPDDKGLASNKGCPNNDIDEDGIEDKMDECPEVKGLISANGCPDSDEDGISDYKDECPDIVGVKAFNGCPDSDEDGIEDRVDRCPNVPGLKNQKGCPEIKKEDKARLEFAMQAIQFDLGKTTLKPNSFQILDEIADIMKKYPDYHLNISGHTDPSGKRETNIKLSENRAKACYNYLVTKSISTGRMSNKGFGPDKPRYENTTSEGKMLNRRTEFEMYLP